MGLWQLLRKAKELWSWYSFAVGVGTLFISGVGLAVAGAIWLIKSGIPLPLALMAGYCTVVGAVYLAMAPFAMRALQRNRLGSKQSNKENSLPNYEAWKHVDTISLLQASRLWCDIDPSLNYETLDSP